ncbi:MAG: phosphate/phosphite/phosphonate ABC transporter substrate-binding protein [Gammaproteobacteria bacterium]|nr:phosphate/phosphite/phosphonate ABC transporter substrate-binding protein [Gammaproteobacteria bacterium]
MKSTLANTVISFTIVLSLLLTSRIAGAGETLTLGVHPFLSNEELIKKFTPLANYLEKKLGMNVRIRVGSNYQEHIRYIGLDKIDIAYMGPASYVQLTDQYGDKPVLSKLEVNGHSYFQGNIITRIDSGIKTLEDLKKIQHEKNNQIAFGDPNSTMSYIVPHHMLHQAGIFTDNSEKHQFLNSHNNVALGVLTGDFQAGAVKPAVFEKFKSKGLFTIAMTPKISEHLFVTRSTLDSNTIIKLKKIMLSMKDSAEGIEALHAIKKSITGLVKAQSSDYDNLRKIISESNELYPR